MASASVTENTILIVKDTMTRIALDRPDLKPTEVLAHKTTGQLTSGRRGYGG